MLDMEKLLICCMNGYVVGFGVILVLMCDVIFVVDIVKIGDFYVVLGLVVGDGGVVIWL